MKKSISKISPILMSVLLGGTFASQTTLAGVAVDDEGKVQLYGDLRLRAEYDNREFVSSTSDDQNRDRLRYRARVGVNWKATDDVTANIRLATGTSDPQSPHANMDLSNHSGGGFGVDRAFATYTGLNNAKVVVGIAAPLYWQQTELFWDGDINLQGLQAAYKMGPATLNASYGVTQENGIPGEDSKVLSTQAVFSQSGITAALGYAGYSKPKAGGFDPRATFGAREFYQIAAQYKSGGFLVGLDYQTAAGVEEEDEAYVLQGRYNLGKNDSVRLYYWHVEANSAHLTQDDSRASSNFEGPEIQFKHKYSKTTSVRARLFLMQQVSDDASVVQSNFNTMGVTKDKDLRLRFDFDVKF